ncbi:MAG: hypothetical protein ABJC66_07695 [Gammaproteobacteria bacterium]
MNDLRSLAEFVDLERYPLLDDAAFAPVAQNCRQQLLESSFANLPGFLRPGVPELMAAEVLQALPRAYRRDKMFTAYATSGSGDLPLDHARRRQHLNRQYIVATDIIGKTAAMRRLYENDVLTRRIAQMLDEPALHRLADPVMACTSTVMYGGDTHGWHFDLNDFVVSILLQASSEGGTFDFAPHIRSDSHENYPAVARVMEGTSEKIRRIRVEPGTLLLFCGRRAIHRVAPIAGTTPRVIALFSYDRKANVRYNPEVYQRVVGRQTVYEA